MVNTSKMAHVSRAVCFKRTSCGEFILGFWAKRWGQFTTAAGGSLRFLAVGLLIALDGNRPESSDVSFAVFVQFLCQVGIELPQLRQFPIDDGGFVLPANSLDVCFADAVLRSRVIRFQF